MASPASRRRAVAHLVGRGFPRARSCRVAGLSRGASRHEPKERRPELRDRVLQLARENPHYGFRRVHALLPGVNLKAVHRVWRAEGLALRHRRRRRLSVPKADGPELTGPGPGLVRRLLLPAPGERPPCPHPRGARLLHAGCLLLKAASSFPSFLVEKELEWLFLVHGRPQGLVSDNGPEFRALALPEGVENRFIQPGKAWQNGHIESFFGRLRDELLSCELLYRGSDLQAALDGFLERYNSRRPHLGIGGLTPARFKEGLVAQSQEEAALQS